MKLNQIPKDDFLWGSMFGCIAFFYTPFLISLVTLLICVALWIVGGQVSPSIRRYGCSAVMGIELLTFNHDWHIVLASLLSFGLLTVGYGIRSINDEGSFWGNFWLKIVGEDSFLTTLLARGSLILGCHLAYFLAIKVF